MGASGALVGRRLLSRGPAWRAAGLWAVVSFTLLLFVPSSVYLTARFPAWRLGSEELAAVEWARWAFAGAGPIVATGSFLLARSRLLSGSPLAAWSLLLGGVALCAVAVGDTVGLLGLTAHLRPRGRELQLLYLAGAAAVVLAVGWLAALWRLHLFSRSALGGVAPANVVARDGRTKPVVRPAGQAKGAGEDKDAAARVG